MDQNTSQGAEGAEVTQGGAAENAGASTAAPAGVNVRLGDDAGAGAQTGNQQAAGQADAAASATEGTDASGGNAEPTKDPAAADAAGLWGEQWREAYAGDDQAKLNTLKRYNSPKDVMDAMFTARADLQKMMANQPPAKDAKPEQIAAYRKSQGIPEKAEGYFEKLDKGIVFGEADKPMVMKYLEAAHARNDSPEVVAETLSLYHQTQAEAIAALQQRDQSVLKETDETLKKEWGGEYQANIEHFYNFVEASFPAGIKEALMNARMGDANQTPLMLNTDFVRAMTTIAREMNPVGTTIPGNGMDKLDAIEEQIAAYKKEMGTKEWFKDTKKQQHYRDLVSARERLSSGGQRRA